MDIKLLSDRVMIRRILQERTNSGLFLPNLINPEIQIGEVVVAGNGKTYNSGVTAPLTVKKGDNVIFGNYTGVEVTLEGNEYIIMHEYDILGIIDKK